jgi:hypothetical protein
VVIIAMLYCRILLAICITFIFAPLSAAEISIAFLRTYCIDCHTGATPEAGLDLSKLTQKLDDGETFRQWVKIYDRVQSGEMPPKDSTQPKDNERSAWSKSLQTELLASEKSRRERDGLTPIRRLTRAEYENTVRDLLGLDGIPLQSGLPDDGSAYNFDKNSVALDISHVNLAKYVEAADLALDMAIATQPTPPKQQTHRFSLAQHVNHILMNGDAVMLKDGKSDPAYVPGQRLAHVGVTEHAQVGKDSIRRGSSVGIFRHEDESFKPYFYDVAVLYPGQYRIKTAFWSFGWDKGTVVPARGVEAARLSVVQLQDDGRGGGHPSYILGYYDAPPDKPMEHELRTWLNPKDTIGFNAASLAPAANYFKPQRAMEFTGPGIACDYFEIEGPIHAQWPPVSHQRLFGDLPLASYDAKVLTQSGLTPPKRKLVRRETQAPNQPDPTIGNWTVASVWPKADADKLLATFLPRAFRRPVTDETRAEYLALVEKRLAAGDCFEMAMRYAYRAALCSPDFLYHVEQTGYYDDHALASRLSYMLWNSMPDEALLAASDATKLRTPKALREEVERMLKDPRSQRFIDDFLGQWLNLRKIAANDPDRKLYPEFSTYLQDSMIAETRAYFRELLEKDLPVSYLVKSDFAMLNEKLATLYGIPGVSGSKIQRVQVPPGCPRGPFLTQAAVLKVTANGTTTSPVPRGAFVMSRFLGQPPEPPPPNIPAVEPDVQGATTIRELLDKHRSVTVCAGCHSRIDPPGFALESFDVIGGQRDHYRAIRNPDEPAAPRGLIDPFINISFKLGPKVDASGQFADGRKFTGIEEFQTQLASNQRVLLENLAEQFMVYGTGRPISFADRQEIARIVDVTQKKAGGGIRSLLHEVIANKLFLPSGDPKGVKPKLGPTIVLPTTPTHQTPSNVPVAVKIEVKNTDWRHNVVATDKPVSEWPTARYRLIGLNAPERLEDLRINLEELPEVRVVDVNTELQEITLAYDLRRLYPQSGVNHVPTPDNLQQVIDGRLRNVSRGQFSLKPLLAEKRATLKRDEITIAIPDCPPCRTGIYNIAIKVDGVEQASVVPGSDKVVLWLDPAKTDLKPLLDAYEKARVKLLKTDEKKDAP